MSRKRKRKNQAAERAARARAKSRAPEVHPEVKKIIAAVIFFIVTAVLVLSYIGKAGAAGGLIFRAFDSLLGKGYFFAPLTLLFIGCSLLGIGEQRSWGVSTLGGAVFLLSNLAILHILFGASSGGLLGRAMGSSLLSLFDFWVSMVMVVGALVISVLLMFNMPFWRRGEGVEESAAGDTGAEQALRSSAASDAADNLEPGVLAQVQAALQQTLGRKNETAADVMESAAAFSKEGSRDDSLAVRKIARQFSYQKPPLELLQGDHGTPSSGDIKANSNIIKRTLENFGIVVDMDNVSVGPTLTQYTLKPAEGVKLSRITALHNDLSLALAAHPIRIEAPIPGKALVGIEVPNKSIALVGLRALLEQKTFQDASLPLLFALGRDVTGSPVFADLARMPHLLVSGATGSGKSVAMHGLITSLLYRNPPELLRFILVDPKRVELSVYNDIAHLLTPVITDAKTTVQALRWATKEMDRRYDLLSLHHARDIGGYNAAMARSDQEELLPYVVIIIDELADLMATFPREVEASIIRLAQMARAVGMHLVVATQRPSVEVITGLIKANITSRLALQVASQIDSRTILDMAGAEKLLGNGDMLFLAGDTSKPRRIQGAYVAEAEVKRVVDFLREEMRPEFESEILTTKVDESERNSADALDEDDPLYHEAHELILQAQKASASYLQRRLRVGYARAARLLDLLEQNGVIGPGDGAKPREVLMQRDGENSASRSREI